MNIDGLEGVLWGLEHGSPRSIGVGCVQKKRKTKGDLPTVCSRGKMWAGWGQAVLSHAKGQSER